MAEPKLDKELKALLDQHDCPNCPTKDSCLSKHMIEYERTHEGELESVVCYYHKQLESFAKTHVYSLFDQMQKGNNFQEFIEECYGSTMTAFLAGWVFGLQAQKKGGE
jgi:hypothetical protein